MAMGCVVQTHLGEARPCPSFPGYLATKDGRVFTQRRRYGKGRGNGGGVLIDPTFVKALAAPIGHGGYPTVSVSLGGKQRPMPVHRLVLDAWDRPRLPNEEACHKNGVPGCNHISNLYWGTSLDNARDRTKHGHTLCGSNHPRAKLDEGDVRALRIHHCNGSTIAELARQFRVSESAARDAITGRRWKRVV